jgi:hypothetical protein
MAVYIPAGRRRRQAIVLGVVALLVGLALGFLAGRSSAPTIDEQLAAVHDEATETASGLRVLALHGEEETVGSEGGGGADLVIERTRDELAAEFDDAPWLSQDAEDELLAQLDELAAITDRGSTEFAAAAEALAEQIEATFGA